jgi:hypothetical protein
MGVRTNRPPHNLVELTPDSAGFCGYARRFTL